MAGRLKHEMALKKGIYKQIKNDETNLRGKYVELVRSVKKNTRVAKRSYEIRVANEARRNSGLI